MEKWALFASHWKLRKLLLMFLTIFHWTEVLSKKVWEAFWANPYLPRRILAYITLECFVNFLDDPCYEPLPWFMITLVAPRDEIPPQICSFKGCLGRGFNRLHWRFYLKHNLECLSNWTMYSPIKITFSYFSLVLCKNWHQRKYLHLFKLCINWQKWCFVHTNPSIFLVHLMVRRETFSSGYFSFRILRSCREVSLSFSFSSESINCFISPVSFFGHFIL